MIFQSERLPMPLQKWWSPMSFGSFILSAFGAISFVSFADALLARGRSRWLHRESSSLGKVVSVVGAIVGLALAGYTGTVLNVTNEPVWADSPWISALFVFSGISTGLATIVLFARRAPHTTVEKLEEADNYLMGLELVTLLIFLVTLGAVGVRFIFGTPLVVLFAIVILLGLLAPLVLHLRPTLAGGVRTASTLAAVLVLVGGFVLRWAVLAGPQGIGL
jgi:protein NrfD